MTTSMQCLNCKHYSGLSTCDAYPDKIPQEIFDGRVVHTEPYPGDGGIMFEPIDVKLSPDQIKEVATKLSDKGLLKKFEIPDEILEQAGVDPKKMSPDQLKAMFAQLAEKGLLKPKPGDKKPTDKKPEEAPGAGRPGLVKKKVKVTRGGKTFEQTRWVKADEEEPAEKPDKVDEKPPEKPPEKPKGPVIMGLNKPEDEVEEPEEEKPEKGKEEPKDGKFEIITKMTKENVESIKSFGDMDIIGGVNEEDSNIIEFKDGSKAIYKITTDNGIQGEMGMKAVGSILAWDNAPETVSGDFGKGSGTCQKWVPDIFDVGIVGDKVKTIETKHYDDLSKILLMDIMTGNDDRHAGNIKIDKDDKVWAIDNDTWGYESDYGPNIEIDLDESVVADWLFFDDRDDQYEFQSCIDKNIKHIIKHKKEIIDHYDEILGRKNDFDDSHLVETFVKNMKNNFNKILNYKKERDEYYD